MPRPSGPSRHTSSATLGACHADIPLPVHPCGSLSPAAASYGLLSSCRLANLLLSVCHLVHSAQYSFGSMAIAIVVMSTKYCTSTTELCLRGIQAPWVAGTANAAVFMGAVVGQLSMGYIGDIIGRSNAFMLTMSIATIGNICTAIIPSGSANTVYALITLFRFFLGVGVGGVYPLSATKAAEDDGNADGSKVDPRTAAWAFFWQMPGILGPWLVAYLISFNDTLTTDARWRMIVGFGAVPTGLATLCLYLERKTQKFNDTMTLSQEKLKANNEFHAGNVDSPGSTDDDAADDEDTFGRSSKSVYRGREKSKSQATVSSLTDSFASHAPKYRLNPIDPTTDSKASAKSLYQSLKSELRTDEHFVAKFLVSGGCWFLFDIVVYGIGLFTGEIVHSIISPSSDISSNESVKMLTSRAMIVQALGVPATVVVIVLLPYISLIKVQAYAFAALGLACLTFGCSYYSLRAKNPHALFGLYCFLGFTMQCGVNVTSYVFPSLMFRKEVRSSFNGVAAAMGKSGAILGAYLFPLIADHVQHGYAVVMIVTTGLCFLGTYITLQYCLPSMLHDINSDSGRLSHHTNSVREALDSANRFQQMEAERERDRENNRDKHLPRVSETLRNSSIEMSDVVEMSAGARSEGPPAPEMLGRTGNGDVEAGEGDDTRNPIQSQK